MSVDMLEKATARVVFSPTTEEFAKGFVVLYILGRYF